MAEWSKALVLGTSLLGRGFESRCAQSSFSPVSHRPPSHGSFGFIDAHDEGPCEGYEGNIQESKSDPLQVWGVRLNDLPPHVGGNFREGQKHKSGNEPLYSLRSKSGNHEFVLGADYSGRKGH